MMEPILGEFEELIGRRALSAPHRPATCAISPANGPTEPSPIPRSGAGSSVHRALRRRAQHDPRPQGTAGPNPLLLEVGPGRTLVTFAAQSANGGRSAVGTAVATGPDDDRSDTAVVMDASGQIWTTGVASTGSAFHRDGRRRVSLPTYPFERETYWVGDIRTCPAARSEGTRCPWFYRPSWREAPLASKQIVACHGRILVLDDATSLGAAVVAPSHRPRWLVRSSSGGLGFEHVSDDEFVIDPAETAPSPACSGRLTERDTDWRA